MKIEKLRKNNSKKYFLCGLISVVVLTITVTFITSKANYRMTASIPLTEGKVTASPYDINIVALYLDNVEQDSNTIIPSGYKINEDSSYCYKGTNKSNRDSNAKLYTDELGNHSFSGISKSSKCILYLEKINYEAKTMSELLETHYKAKATRTSKNKDFNVPYSATTYGVVFTALDNDGTSYYFAGNPLDNWVEFGGYYWRIVRVNGDGSIRMIYQGRTQDENGNKLEPQTTGNETHIGASNFNEKSDDNAYIGFMYGTPNSDTYETTHENKNDSTMKKFLDNWFENSNIKQGTSYFDKIDLNAGFCGDRIPSTSNSIINNQGGIGIVNTSYGSLIRVFPNRQFVTPNTPQVIPTYACSNENDLYTYKNSNKGNKTLKNPIGLITADEVAYAGFIDNYNSGIRNNYLTIGLTYWTISPSNFEAASKVYLVQESGFLEFYHGLTTSKLYVRPIINLRSDVTFTGNGTQSNPFKVI
ncbi:MAG: hypothetical protein NC483_03980 [Ruminococcus sp.]|nr:hypothetical protein [Ruminococcus sp.]